MKLETWSELTCPWCGLGAHRLERALAQFEHRADVEVVHRSLELHPESPVGVEVTTRQILRSVHGLDDARAEAATRQVEQLAAREGLSPYVVLDNVVGSTALAHELLALATDRGIGHLAWRRAFRWYFGERRSLFTVDALVELAVELGLDPVEAREALHDRRYRSRVEADARRAHELGATGAPFLLIDGRRPVHGALTSRALLQTLHLAWDARPAPRAVDPDAELAPSCGPDGCALPAPATRAG